MRSIVWIHADCLRRDCAAFREYPAVPALFVWDDVVLRGYGLSLKRMVFLYECLLDLDPSRKPRLREGLDDIGLTLQRADRILAFEVSHRAA
jgi:hypothetical protein